MIKAKLLKEIDSEYPKNLIRALQICLLAINDNISKGFEFRPIEEVVEALLGAARFSNLAIEYPNADIINEFIQKNENSGMLLYHKIENKYFFIASSFSNSLKFREYVS